MLSGAKISTYKIKKIIECFCLDLTATQTSKLLGLNRKTINRYYGLFRRGIHRYQTGQLRRFVGEIEVDESYFGGNRIKGKRGRGTFKQPVFGIYERNGRVYTEVIKDCKRRTLRSIIKGQVKLESMIYSDSWKGYDGLVDVGYNKHFRINHGKDEFSDRNGVHINGIESFLSFTKRRLTKFNGVKKNFEKHLKECEWRWGRNEVELRNDLIEILKFYDL